MNKIEEINSCLKREMWYDFEVLEYKEKCLVVIGSTDFSYSHSIELKFNDVFCFTAILNGSQTRLKMLSK
jgi:hypothetical protein